MVPWLTVRHAGPRVVVPDRRLDRQVLAKIVHHHLEKELILRALRKFDWNQTHAAQFLDLSRKALIYRMEKFGLRKEQQEGSQPGTRPAQAAR